MSKAKVWTGEIPGAYAGRRLDQALAELLPDVTRSQLQQWIADGRVAVGGRVPRKRDTVRGGERVTIEVPPPATTTQAPEAIVLDIVYEDDVLLVVNKPAGLVVHPGAGNRKGTLLNALLYRAPQLAQLPRAGIVHRLDKDTSGLMVVAKTERARQQLIHDLQTRKVARDYIAVVNGAMIAGGTVAAPVGRHPTIRTRMAVTARGKSAVSHYRVARKYRAHTLVHISLESGRTHQIRVHLAHIKFPVIGDPVYGGRLRIPPGATAHLARVLQDFRRQALHAAKLALIHPETGQPVHWSASVPADMSRLMEALAEDARQHEQD